MPNIDNIYENDKMLPMTNGVQQLQSSDIFQTLREVTPEVLSLFLDRYPNAIHEQDVKVRQIGGTSILESFNPIHEAALMGDVEIITTLQSKGANPNRLTGHNFTPLMIAASKGHEAAVAHFLTCDGVSINAVNQQNETALTLAIINDHAGVVRQLIAAGADVNLQAGDVPPLVLAVLQTKVVLNAVLEAADINLNIQDKNGRTALNAAFYKGNEDYARLLYQRGADINLAMTNGRTPLMAAARGCCEQGIAYLLAQKVDPNLTDLEGYSALHFVPLHTTYAATVLRTAELLLRGGVYYDPVNKFGHTAFDIARDIASNNSRDEHKTALHAYFCKIQDEPWVKRKPGPDLAFVHKGMPVKTALMKRVQLRPRGI